MRSSVLLVLFAACRLNERPPEPISELDQTIEANWNQIKKNNKAIAELERSLLAVEERTTAVRKMIDCTNAAIDSSMNDRDQVLTITECFRAAGYR